MLINSTVKGNVYTVYLKDKNFDDDYYTDEIDVQADNIEQARTKAQRIVNVEYVSSAYIAHIERIW